MSPISDGKEYTRPGRSSHSCQTDRQTDNGVSLLHICLHIYHVKFPWIRSFLSLLSVYLPVSDRQTDKQTESETDRQTDRQTDCFIDFKLYTTSKSKVYKSTSVHYSPHSDLMDIHTHIHTYNFLFVCTYVHTRAPKAQVRYCND